MLPQTLIYDPLNNSNIQVSKMLDSGFCFLDIKIDPIFKEIFTQKLQAYIIEKNLTIERSKH
jgi:hypothetical protein